MMQIWFILIGFVAGTHCDSLNLVKTYRTGQNFTNLEYYNGKLFIGSQDKIHVFNELLDLQYNVSTCKGNEVKCNNLNKVLVVNDNYQQLIFCGTGKDGICEARNITSLNDTHTSSNNDSNTAQYLQVSFESRRPALGVITETNDFLIAITYGMGMGSYKEFYKYPISVRKTEHKQDGFKTFEQGLGTDSFLTLNVKQVPNDYIIYYRGKFQNNGSSYFVTNQKEYVRATKYVSKIVQICGAVSTYVDLVTTCTNNNENYNLVQDAVLINVPNTAEKYVVFTFANGTDAENPNKKSAICMAKLSELNQNLLQAKITFASFCNESVERSEEDRRYLRNTKIGTNTYNCANNQTIVGVSQGFEKCEILVQYSYVIGKEAVPLTFAKAFNSELITTLYASTLNGNSILLAGTSDGTVIMMNVQANNVTVYHTLQLPRKNPVKAIYMKNEDDHIFVMTSNEVFRYNHSNCDEYKTCSDVVKGQNPMCGWCIFKNRSTRNEATLCPATDWLAAVNGKCVSITPNITAVEVGEGMSSTVRISAANFQDTSSPTSYSYQCQFENGTVIYNTTATRGGSVFFCSSPTLKVHMDATLRLLVNTGTAVIELASHPFLFYSCDYYRKCSACVGLCIWCDQNVSCVSKKTNAGCPGNETKNSAQCPSLQKNEIVIPRSVSSTVLLKSQNVNPKLNYNCVVRTGSEEKIVQAKVNDGGNISCNLTITSGEEAKNSYHISIKYGNSNNLVEMDDFNNNAVTVYSCSSLGKDCYHCGALKKSFNCLWCSQKCEFDTECRNRNTTCPNPTITQIDPIDGHNLGGTSLTIYGKNLGFKNSSRAVMLGQSDCNISGIIFSKSEDLIVEVVDKIVCKTKEYRGDYTVPVKVTVNGSISNTNISFIYKIPNITNLSPRSGPLAGGTRITFTGDNLGIGNRNITNIVGGAFLCTGLEVFPKTVIGSSKTSWIECVSPSWKSAKLDITFQILLDGQGLNSVSFLYTTNPTITSISPKKAFLSGGTIISLQGQNMTNAHRSEITVSYDEENKTQLCTIVSSTLTTCKVPEASEKLKEKLNKTLKANQESDIARRKRDTNSASQEVTIFVNLDGVKDSFTVLYFRDPEIDPFAEEVLVYGTDKQDLVIKGRYLNLVATKYDVRVTIGLEECSVVELTEFNIRCLAPKSQPASGEKSHLPEVNVTIGNIKVRVGYLEYEKKLETAYIIGGAVAGGLLFIIVMVVVIGIYKYRKVGEKARDYQKNLSDMEMEIRRVAREEFLDMHTTMSSVNRNLVEQGFPYHSYQQYACNVMFSVDYLWTEPVVSNGKMTDDERIKANKGMELMESLIYNKFFIVSVISTMEKQKRFFIREKANLAGNLCAVLMGKMDYLEEILKMLLSNLVQETPSKKQKSLFRRCESITEKLLSNWLSLCLYPHIRANSGSPLYLLYIATQKTMESGPIDAILGDAKYTLFEEKLLKKWSSAEEGTQDLKFEAKTLTLNVVVDNGDTIFKCKVLDCDTISQVKSKCMAQIYVNYPASQLNVDPQDLDLEWHEGFGGALRLKDEDNTSKHDGPWVRLNTLAHYNVKDESNMALVDPHGAENREEDYVNLTNVNVDNACNASVDSTEPLHPRDMQNPGALQHWHLVRKEEETSKQGKSAIAELYLNRLFTTKQCLMEYISTLFNIVLEKDRCPPPTKCLFDFLDDLGDRHKIDADTLYTWKSHSYAIRVWASLIKMPSLLFDVNIPNYVEENLDVISQVFIESFSLSSQKFTKDSPSQKLIFHNEMNLYRDKVKEFYKNVKVDSQAQDEYRQYMTEVNKQQQQTNFNKVSALYRLYKQLKPYFEEILEDLTTCKETSNLRLNKKLEEVMEIMEDEEK